MTEGHDTKPLVKGSLPTLQVYNAHTQSGWEEIDTSSIHRGIPLGLTNPSGTLFLPLHLHCAHPM